MTRRRTGILVALLLSAVVVGSVWVFAPRYMALLPSAFVGVIGVISIVALLVVRDLSRRDAIVLVGAAAVSISAVIAVVGLPMFIHL